MFTKLSNSLLSYFSAISLSVITCSHAQLPSFEETSLLGYFAYGTDDRMIVKVSVDADISAHPIGKNGEEKPYLKVPFKFSIRQTLPNGKVRRLKLNPESLKSDGKVTDKLKEVTITGEAGKGATFEITLVFKRDTLTLGGRVTGNGTEKFPLSFHYQSRIHHYHGRLLERLKGDQKEFDKIVGKDWFRLHRTDKKKEKRSLTDIFATGDAETLNGPGSSKVEIQASIIDKKKRMLVFEAKGPSLYTLTKPNPGPFHTGYHLEWTSDQEKDPDNEARLVFEIDDL